MEDLGASLETAGAAVLEMAVSATLERGGKIVPCKNCSAPVFDAYCAACGQPTDIHRRSLLRLLRDLFRDIASFDSRILRTIRALFFEPGELSLAFRDGRTQRYVPPVRLYLFVSLIFFLFLSVTGIAILQIELGTTTHRIFRDGSGRVFEEKNGVTNPMEGLKADTKGNVFANNGKDAPGIQIYGMKADGKAVDDLSTNALFFSPAIKGHGQLSPGLQGVLYRLHVLLAGVPIGSSLKTWLARHLDRMLQKLATDPAAINGLLTEWIPRTLFFLLPVFALMLAVFYWRQRRDFYFVDHLVFSLNMHSFAFAIILVAIILARVIAGDTAAEFAILAIVLYLFLAMNRFYRQGWIWTAVKFALVSFAYVAFFLAPALAGILVASLLYL